MVEKVSEQHWVEVLKLAEEYGFIVQAYGGVALLATHEVQKEKLGEKKYEQIQDVNKGVLNE